MPDISIANIAVTDANAKALRAVNKYGLNLADFAALTTSSRFDNFGNGGTYTVSNWISDGVFANLGAVQAVYPVCQSGSDYVDWVLLQSAVDFLIYGSLGSANIKTTKRRLFIPAGNFLINRSLHVGYNRVATPPANLNGNGYVSITIEGEGPNPDVTGNGMTGTSITTEALTYPGIVLHGYQQVILRGFTLAGPYDSYLANNNPYRASNSWDRAAWRQTSPAIADANWIGGAAVNIGIGIDLYTNSTAAAAYPARVLPSYFGGGTTTASFGTAGGTDVLIDDVNVKGFIIGVGRPHGDSNGEFLRVNRGKINNCVHGVVICHSQMRNFAIRDTDFNGFHTAIANRGGLTATANLHGTYENVHFGTGFQVIEHVNADWSGPLTMRDCYAESVSRIGGWNGPVRFDGCYFSFIEQEGTDGVPYNHFDITNLTIDNCQISGLRHGLFGGFSFTANGGTNVDILGRTSIRFGDSSNLSALGNVLEVTRGLNYFGGVFTQPGHGRRRLVSRGDNTDVGTGNSMDVQTAELRAVSTQTYLDQTELLYYAMFPAGENVNPLGSSEMQGSVQRFPVPKITSRYPSGITITSRSGFDLTCPRTSIADIKADVGDVFVIDPGSGDAALRIPTWFIVVAISGSNMTLRQLSNFNSTSPTDYSTNGFTQISNTVGGAAFYTCTRIRKCIKLFVGDVTSGSAVISNVRHAFQFGTTDQFNSSNFDMAVGDYFLHQEIERSLSTGGVKVHNRVSAIDYTANTITLTENFNITRTAYPIVFYVETYNA